jgi:hypothetical protein
MLFYKKLIIIQLLIELQYSYLFNYKMRILSRRQHDGKQFVTYVEVTSADIQQMKNAGYVLIDSGVFDEIQPVSYASFMIKQENVPMLTSSVSTATTVKIESDSDDDKSMRLSSSLTKTTAAGKILSTRKSIKRSSSLAKRSLVICKPANEDDKIGYIHLVGNHANAPIWRLRMTKRGENIPKGCVLYTIPTCNVDEMLTEVITRLVKYEVFSRKNGCDSCLYHLRTAQERERMKNLLGEIREMTSIAL